MRTRKQESGAKKESGGLPAELSSESPTMLLERRCGGGPSRIVLGGRHLPRAKGHRGTGDNMGEKKRVTDSDW